MIAFHGKQSVKKEYLARVKAHAKADEIIKGQYWQGGKGCAVGCTIHGSEHSRYETELGIPEWLARVEDTLFEGMSNEKAKKWPAQFLSAIKPGADLESVKAPFIIMILKHSLKSMENTKFDREKNPQVVEVLRQSEAAVKQMIEAWKTDPSARSAESAARSAESAARSAAWSAARSAESAESAARSAESAARSAESAARSAARSAESAARSAAESAAWSAAWSAESAARSAARSAAWKAVWSAAWSAARSAESAAWSAARSAAYDHYSVELLKLLKKAK